MFGIGLRTFFPARLFEAKFMGFSSAGGKRGLLHAYNLPASQKREKGTGLAAL
jgi:hypothetical protein